MLKFRVLCFHEYRFTNSSWQQDWRLCKSVGGLFQKVTEVTAFPVISLLIPCWPTPCTAAGLNLFLCEAVHVEIQ